ncbi:MAG: polysaccharide export protein [Sphingomonadaceae bacterium]|nr:polysaccharide export protein [Sphingomonadaceae bacterium]
MKSWMIALTTVTAMALTSCASGERGLSPLASTAPTPYQLGTGDQLRVNVYGLDMMNDTYLVGDTGSVSLPMIGAVPVAGKTVEVVEKDIADTLRTRNLLVDPKVSAQVVAYRPFFIVGEVQKPGQYPYVPGMSVLTAISVAGGYTFRANTKEVTVTRAKQKGSATPDSNVMPGDLIQIRESWF